jgi:GR25 family glycosyltransferase involved in LPS biosynthesis
MNIQIIILILIIIFIFTKSKETYINVDNNIKLSSKDFDVYLINMPQKKDRLINFTKYYNNSDLKFKQFNILPAIVGKDLNLIEFVSPEGYKQILELEKTGNRKHHYDLSRGAVGCYLSHLSIYKQIVNSNYNYGIIFEDDSEMIQDIYKNMIEGLNKIPNNWDILLLGHICIKCDINTEYTKVHRFWGTHSYIIKKESADKLLKYLDKPLSKQIDADMSLLVKRGIINIYALNMSLAMQSTKFYSDIQSDVIESNDSFNEE